MFRPPPARASLIRTSSDAFVGFMGAASSWIPGSLESFSSGPEDVPKALRPLLDLRLEPWILIWLRWCGLGEGISCLSQMLLEFFKVIWNSQIYQNSPNMMPSEHPRMSSASYTRSLLVRSAGMVSPRAEYFAGYGYGMVYIYIIYILYIYYIYIYYIYIYIIYIYIIYIYYIYILVYVNRSIISPSFGLFMSVHFSHVHPYEMGSCPISMSGIWFLHTNMIRFNAKDLWLVHFHHFQRHTLLTFVAKLGPSSLPIPARPFLPGATSATERCAGIALGSEKCGIAREKTGQLWPTRTAGGGKPYTFSDQGKVRVENAMSCKRDKTRWNKSQKQRCLWRCV